MNEEIKTLHENERWELVDLPLRRKVIGNKWVFKIKNNDGLLEHYEAHLVEKGYM